MGAAHTCPKIEAPELIVVIDVDTGAKTIVTQTKPSDFPSHLRQKLQSSVQSVERHNIQTESIAQERCPKCGREEVRYTSVQMRSADEGSTNIYNCDCGHSYVTNPDLVSQLLCLQPTGGMKITEWWRLITFEMQQKLLYTYPMTPALKLKLRPQQPLELMRIQSRRSFHTRPCPKRQLRCPEPPSPRHEGNA